MKRAHWIQKKIVPTEEREVAQDRVKKLLLLETPMWEKVSCLIISRIIMLRFPITPELRLKLPADLRTSME